MVFHLRPVMPPAIPVGDGDVDFDDLIGGIVVDVDGSGSVGFSDLLTLLGN